MDVNYKGCTGCSLDWRPLSELNLLREGRAHKVLCEKYNLVVGEYEG